MNEGVYSNHKVERTAVRICSKRNQIHPDIISFAFSFCHAISILIC